MVCAFFTLSCQKLAKTINMFIQILFAFLFLFLYLFILKHKISHKHPSSPPGPSRLPLIGNLHQLSFTSPHLSLWNLSKVHGPLMSLHFGCRPSIIISSGRIAKEVIKHHDLVFSSRPSLFAQEKLSYNCVDIAFAPYNDYWKQIRKICVLNLFSPKIIQSFRGIREDSVKNMVEKIKISSAISPLQAVNLSEDIIYLTSSVICKIAFGKDYVSEGCKEINLSGLLGETQAVLGGFWFADFFPLGGWIDKFRELSSQLARAFKELDMFYERMIQEHVEVMKERKGVGKDEDMIDLLLKLKEDQSSSLKLNFDHIKAVLMNIFIGATDTTAATLVWALTLLIKNPRVMNKIQEEVRLVIEKQGFVHEGDLPKLVYLKAVVKETLRLNPPVPLLLPRETTQWCKVNAYAIKPKTLVYFNAWAIGRDPECWDNPLEFFPERFLDWPMNKGQELGFMTFGGGRRGCPGTTMAYALVELALANLLYTFDWELPKGMKVEDVDTEAAPGIAVHKKVPLYLIAKNMP